MKLNINDGLEGISYNAEVSLLDETYNYFQVTPKEGLPFFIRYDESLQKWKTVAEIYRTDPKIVEVVGSWINQNLKRIA
jgi:hypothetical protein